MIKSDILNNLHYTNNDEILLVHDAYKKEFSHLSNQHQIDLDYLEKFYKKELLNIIKEKHSISFQLQSILLTLLENFQKKLKNLRQNHISMYSEMDSVDDMYLCILQCRKRKEKDLINEILKLKEIVMEEKKRNTNISTTIILLKKENFLLKKNLSYYHELSEILQSKTELSIAVFSLLFIVTIVYYKKDNALKERSIKWYLFGFLLLVTMFWNLVRIVKKNTLILINKTFRIFCILILMILLISFQ